MSSSFGCANPSLPGPSYLITNRFCPLGANLSSSLRSRLLSVFILLCAPAGHAAIPRPAAARLQRPVHSQAPNPRCLCAPLSAQAPQQPLLRAPPICGNEEAAVPADVVRASPEARFEERLPHASLELGAALHLHRPVAEELQHPHVRLRFRINDHRKDVPPVALPVALGSPADVDSRKRRSYISTEGEPECG